MNHYFEMGYCDGLYGNYYGKSAAGRPLNQKQLAAYDHGYEEGRKDLLAGKLDK